MDRRLLGVLAAGVILSSMGCIGSLPPTFEPREFEAMSGVEAGATADEVRKSLGAPNAWRNGFWTSGIQYREDWQVWYYAGKGRVVFDGFDGRVVLTQADATQPKHAVSQASHGLY